MRAPLRGVLNPVTVTVKALWSQWGRWNDGP